LRDLTSKVQRLRSNWWLRLRMSVKLMTSKCACVATMRADVPVNVGANVNMRSVGTLWEAERNCMSARAGHIVLGVGCVYRRFRRVLGLTRRPSSGFCAFAHRRCCNGPARRLLLLLQAGRPRHIFARCRCNMCAADPLEALARVNTPLGGAGRSLQQPPLDGRAAPTWRQPHGPGPTAIFWRQQPAAHPAVGAATAVLL
jgi:hypothetical protein